MREGQALRLTPGAEPEWLEGGGSTDCDGAAVLKLFYEVPFMSISPVNDLAALCGGCWKLGGCSEVCSDQLAGMR